jgi:hypothetical protein
LSSCTDRENFRKADVVKTAENTKEKDRILKLRVLSQKHAACGSFDSSESMCLLQT